MIPVPVCGMSNTLPANLLTTKNLNELWFLVTKYKSLSKCTSDVQVLWDAIQPFSIAGDFQITRNSRLHRWIVRDGCLILYKVHGDDADAGLEVVLKWLTNPLSVTESGRSDGFYIDMAAFDPKTLCVWAVARLATNYWQQAEEWGISTLSAESAGAMCEFRCRLLASIEPLLPEPTWP